MAEALAGVQTVIDAASQPTPEQDAATAFFTASTRKLQEVGRQAGVQRIVVVSIIGIDRFTGGFLAAKKVHEEAMLAGPIPVRILRAAQFHEFVAELVGWGTQDGVGYVPNLRTQLVAARTVAEALVALATLPDPAPAGTGTAPFPEIAGPREERLVEMARLLAPVAATRSASKKSSMRTIPTATSTSKALLPGPHATLAGLTYEEWLERDEAASRAIRQTP